MVHKIKVHFLGGSGTVTGSKFLIEAPNTNILVDCGLFQGLKELRVLNWQPLPYDASKIDTVLITHGHLDHVGYLPLLHKQGFKGNIWATAPSIDIAEIILTDTAKIQEEDAEHANKEGYSKHSPAKPLYGMEDVENVLPLFKMARLGEWFQIAEGVRVKFRYNGHILGACFIELELFKKRFVFSGDIGRMGDAVLYDPETPNEADYLFLESTYGGKAHPEENPEEFVAELIHNIVHTGGTLIIPSFAVERAQYLMYLLFLLYRSGNIPKIAMVLDSPMGNKVFSLFRKYESWHKISTSELNSIENIFKITQDFAETWQVLDDPRPKVIIAGSGMLSGGRVLTYLKHLLDDVRTTILLPGFMAPGTRGRAMLEGAIELKIHGRFYPVKAKVYQLQSLSAHADGPDLLNWVSAIKNIPEKIFLVHGEDEALSALKKDIENSFRYHCYIPKLNEVVTLYV